MADRAATVLRACIHAAGSVADVHDGHHRDPDPACAMCLDAHLDENPFSVLIRSTPTSHLRLSRNQAHLGYGLVILREHATDLAALDPGTRAAFWDDAAALGAAVRQTTGARKVDYLVMGHREPHLHCHVLPQHTDDDLNRTVDVSDGPVRLDDAAFEVLRRDIGAALATTAPHHPS